MVIVPPKRSGNIAIASGLQRTKPNPPRASARELHAYVLPVYLCTLLSPSAVGASCCHQFRFDTARVRIVLARIVRPVSVARIHILAFASALEDFYAHTCAHINKPAIRLSACTKTAPLSRFVYVIKSLPRVCELVCL